MATRDPIMVARDDIKELVAEASLVRGERYWIECGTPDRAIRLAELAAEPSNLGGKGIPVVYGYGAEVEVDATLNLYCWPEDDAPVNVVVTEAPA